MPALADEAIRPAVVCPPRCSLEPAISDNVELIRHPAVDLFLMWRYNKRKLVERLERFEPTVLHCLCRSKARLTRDLSRRLDLPYVLTVNSLRKRWRKLSVSSKRCVKIIVPAKTIAADVAKSHRRFAERIKQVNPAAVASQGCGCFGDPARIASMVTVGPVKNDSRFENLLLSVKRLAIEGYEFLLVIIGGGAQKQLRKSLIELGLSRIVVNVPRIRPFSSVLAAGDIFIRPQPSAAFEPLLLEAMSVGTAVAACTGGVDDLIIQGQTAIVFDPDDELSIYDTLRKLLDRRELARQLAADAQEYVRENHSPETMTSSILRIYREARDSFES